MTSPRIPLDQQLGAVSRAVARLRHAGGEANDLACLEAAERTMRWLSVHLDDDLRAFVALSKGDRSIALAAATAPVVEMSKNCKLTGMLDKPKRGRPSKHGYGPAFEAFWSAYPTTPVMSKKTAGEAFARLSAEDQAAATAAIAGYREHLSKNPTLPVVHAVRFITQRRFDGFASAAAATPVAQVFVVQGSPEWAAWTAARGKALPTTQHGGQAGWWFPTATPPEVTP